MQRIVSTETSLPRVPQRAPIPKKGRKGYLRPGRPRHVPDAQRKLQVIRYAKKGLPKRQIAVLIGVSIHTLCEEYRDEVDLGRAQINSQVGGKIATLAGRGVQWASTLWARTQMGWKETARVEHTGKNGAPIASVVLASSDPLEATRAYLAMVNGDQSYDPNALPVQPAADE
jgi:transposase